MSNTPEALRGSRKTVDELLVEVEAEIQWLEDLVVKRRAFLLELQTRHGVIKPVVPPAESIQESAAPSDRSSPGGER